MAEQGGGWTLHFLSLIADLCFPATLLILRSIRYYQGHHLNRDQNLAGRPSYSTHAFPLFFFILERYLAERKSAYSMVVKRLLDGWTDKRISRRFIILWVWLAVECLDV
jgi:hypothetical protein